MLKLNSSPENSKCHNRRRQVGRLGLRIAPPNRRYSRAIQRGFAATKSADCWRMVPVFKLRSRSGAVPVGVI